MITYEQFVKEVEKDLAQNTPVLFERYKACGGSNDEDAKYFLSGEYNRYKITKDLKHAVNCASSCIYMEY
jgi:hypothetical protein